MRTTLIGRVAAMAAVVVAAVAVAIVLLGSGGKNYEVRAHFQNASQIVKGNLVQVSGTKVGKVTDIRLTPDGQAELVLKIDDDYAPLREGTEATVRQSSLSGIANRYIDLRLPPAGAPKIKNHGVITQEHTTTAVDLDQLFNVFGPRERRALSGVLRGSATQYAARGPQANRGLQYLNPSIASTSRLFQELDRDPETLRRFINESSQLVTDVAARSSDLSGLVRNLATTTGAIGRRDRALAEAIQRLPDFMRRANTTFVNLRATLDDLDPLVRESKPVAKKLRPFLAELRPLARNARPTVRDLSRLVRQAGVDNDLVELTRSNVPVRNIAIGPVNVNGKSREGAFPATTKSLNGSLQSLSFFRPYSVDLTGWFDDFTHPGYVDALGGGSRAQLIVSLFHAANGVPNVAGGIIPANQRAAVLAAGGQFRQNNRCPGSVERQAPDKSNPFVPYTGFPCDPSQVPPAG